MSSTSFHFFFNFQDATSPHAQDPSPLGGVGESGESAERQGREAEFEVEVEEDDEVDDEDELDLEYSYDDEEEDDMADYLHVDVPWSLRKED